MSSLNSKHLKMLAWAFIRTKNSMFYKMRPVSCHQLGNQILENVLEVATILYLDTLQNTLSHCFYRKGLGQFGTSSLVRSTTSIWCTNHLTNCCTPCFTEGGDTLFLQSHYVSGHEVSTGL